MSARKEGTLNGEGRWLQAWARFEIERELGSEIEAAGFGLLVHGLIYIGIWSGHKPALRILNDAWQRDADLTLKILTLVRGRVPLPSSKSKKMRVWYYLLAPHVYVDTGRNKRRHVGRGKAIDKEISDSLSAELSITPQEVSNLRRELNKQLRERRLI